MLLLATQPYGFTADYIDDSCPAELAPYEKAYLLKIKHQHRQAWLEGYYNHIALSVVLSNAFSDKNHKQENYPEYPDCDREEIERRGRERFNALPPEEQDKVFRETFGIKLEGE